MSDQDYHWKLERRSRYWRKMEVIYCIDGNFFQIVAVVKGGQSLLGDSFLLHNL